MPLFKNGDVTIHYEEAGSGFPLLVIPVVLYNLLALTSGGPVETTNAAGQGPSQSKHPGNPP